MGVMRSAMTENYKKDSYKYFWEKFSDTPGKYEQVYEVVPSDSAYTKFTSAIGLGELLEIPEGEDLQADVPMENYTIYCKNRSFGRLARFSKLAIDDSQQIGNLLRETVGTWGRQVVFSKEKFYAKFFNYGAFTAGHDVFDNTITGVVTDPAGKKIYDGYPFFYTAHPNRVGGTYANYSASNALTHGNLKTIYTTYTSTNNRDERGDIIELRPNTLLIPPALEFTAQVILQTTMLPGSMDNDVNVLRSIVTPFVWSYLTDTDGWFLGSLKQGLMATDRTSAVELDFFQNDLNKDFYATCYIRWGGAVTQWRHWYGNNISSS